MKRIFSITLFSLALVMTPFGFSQTTTPQCCQHKAACCQHGACCHKVTPTQAASSKH